MVKNFISSVIFLMLMRSFMIFLMLMRSFPIILVFTPLNNTNHHHHLLHVTKVLLFQSHISLQPLGEGIVTTTYIIDTLPTKTLSNKTLFELLYSKYPFFLYVGF